ncbi:hypothetical protein [Kitasatospora griseola]|uniref:hypothetical protein n=1 Tax=Kitasatospora griseola TaxID=2064 RepID=UPI00341FDE84
MTITSPALERWQLAVRSATEAAAKALLEAAPSLRPRPSEQLSSDSVALAGQIAGGQVVVLLTCPTHVSIAAFGVPTASADRVGRVLIEPGASGYQAGTQAVASLADVDTRTLGPGHYVPVRVPSLSGGPDHRIKLYAHGMADVDLTQLPVTAAASVLTLLAESPATV